MAGGLLVLFLGMYSWNQRTHTLDDIAANVGLEMSGTVLGTFDSVKGSVMDAWRRYVDLVGVREENERLRAQVAELQARIVSHGEDLAELAAYNQAFVLANHGPVVCGESLQEAANNMEELEETAKLIFILGDRPIRYLTAGEIAELRS